MSMPTPGSPFDSTICEGGQMLVRVDEQMCQGTGYCVRVVPEVFEVRDGIARVVLDGPYDDDLVGRLNEAESFCPSGAISL